MNTRTILGIRKALSFIGILSILSSLVVSIPTTMAADDSYKACFPTWAYGAIDAAEEKGLIDTSLACKNNIVNRAEGYQMLTKGYNVWNEAAVTNFVDVPTDSWYFIAAATAQTIGWTIGDGKGHFTGASAMLRGQLAVAINAVLGLSDAPADATLAVYPDAAVLNGNLKYAKQAVANLVAANIMGKGPKILAEQGATKAEVIVMLNAAVDYADTNDVSVMDVAAERLGVSADDLESALGNGEQFVDGVATSNGFISAEIATEEEVVTEEEVITPTEEEVGTTTVPEIVGSASVSLASDTPSPAVLASGTAFNKVLKVAVSAGSEADVKVTGLTVTRGGLSSNAHLSGVGIYDANDIRHGNIVTSWNDNNQMEIDFSSDPIVVTKGTSSSIMLKANLAVGVNTGTFTLSLTKKEDVKSSATLDGTFPITSRTMDYRDGSTTVAAVTVDAVQVHNNGAADATAVNVNLGTTRQHLSTFRLANSSVEAVKIKSITLYNNGSAADGDVTNITLVGPDGADIAMVAKTTSKYVTFKDINVVLAKSAASKDYKVYADLANGSTRTVRFLLQNDYDLVVTGETSLTDILPTAAAVNDLAFPIGDRSGANFINMVTVSAGTMTLSKDTTSPTGNVAAGATSVVLGRFEVKATGEDMEVRQFSYSVIRSVATDLSGTLYFKVREKDTTNSTTLYSIAGASADYTNNSTAYTTTFVTLKAGKTYFIEAIGDISSSVASNVTYAVTALDVTSVKRISSNDIVDPTVAAVTANTLTTKTGTLSVTANSGATTAQVVAGQSTASLLATWDFTAGAGEGVNLTNIIVGTSTGGQVGASFKELEIWVDGLKKSQDTSATLAPGLTATSVTFNLNPVIAIAAAQSSVVELRGKVLSSAPAGNTVFTITASGISGTGATSQSALSTIPAAAVNGQTVTVNAGGSLTVSRDTVTNVKSSQVVSGSTNVVFGAYKLQTGNIEDVKVKRVTVRNIGSNTNGVVSMGIYDGTTLLNDDVATSTNEGITKASLGSDSSTLGNDTKSVTFDYSSNPFIISKNSYKVLTIKANTVYSATNGETAQFVIDSLDLEGAGSSVKIYPTVTTESMVATTTTSAFAVGEVVIASNGVALSGMGGTSTFVSPVTTALAAAGTSTGVSTLVQGFEVATQTGSSSRVTKLNPIYNGSTIESEVYSTATTYSYAPGDVVAINDNNGTSTTGLHVVVGTVAVGGTLAGGGTLVTGLTLAANDRITKVASGAFETTLAAAATNYNLGDILVVDDVGTIANNGLYTVTNAISVGGDMTAAAVVASQVVQLKSGAALVTGDYVAKMPTLSTELASTAAVYKYDLGDVIVIDDDSTPLNNGVYVVRTAIAIGGDLTAADALGVGITFTTADRISKLYVKSQEDNLKRLYPTKLNFAWTTPAVSSLQSGTPSSQVEVARFTMGADAANANNPGASISVSALNFTELSTANLSNFAITDVTNNVSIASNASSSSFSSTTAGGTMTAQTLQQGETRTYKILADVSTNAGSQTAQFRFNAGSQFTAGTATWSVTGDTTVSSITWTAVAGDAPDTSSTALSAAATGTDTAVPTISTIVVANAGVAKSIDVLDTITITFSEKIDPASFGTTGTTSLLTYGNTVTGIGSTSNMGISVPVTTTATYGTTTTVTVVGIATFGLSETGNTTAATLSTAGANNYIVNANLNTAGTILLITVDTATGATTSTGTMVNGGGTGTSTQVAGTVKDTAGNAMAANAALAKASGTM